MSFLVMIAAFAALSFAGAAIGDPTHRPEHDPAHWTTTTERH